MGRRRRRCVNESLRCSDWLLGPDDLGLWPGWASDRWTQGYGLLLCCLGVDPSTAKEILRIQMGPFLFWVNKNKHFKDCIPFWFSGGLHFGLSAACSSLSARWLFLTLVRCEILSISKVGFRCLRRQGCDSWNLCEKDFWNSHGSKGKSLETGILFIFCFCQYVFLGILFWPTAKLSKLKEICWPEAESSCHLASNHQDGFALWALVGRHAQLVWSSKQQDQSRSSMARKSAQSKLTCCWQIMSITLRLQSKK